MKIISYLLKIGFYISMAFIMAGLLIKHNIGGLDLSTAGISVLLFTPIFLIFSLSIFYLYKKDYKKFLLAVLLIIVLIVNIFL